MKKAFVLSLAVLFGFVMFMGAAPDQVQAKTIFVTIGTGGGFYYTNATAGTVPNDITLSGGTLSAGLNSQTYAGPFQVLAPLFRVRVPES